MARCKCTCIVRERTTNHELFVIDVFLTSSTPHAIYSVLSNVFMSYSAKRVSPARKGM